MSLHYLVKYLAIFVLTVTNDPMTMNIETVSSIHTQAAPLAPY